MSVLLQQKHSLDKLFEGLLMGVLREKPSDPLQFIIDTLSLGPENAAQVRGRCDGQRTLMRQVCICSMQVFDLRSRPRASIWHVAKTAQVP